MTGTRQRRAIQVAAILVALVAVGGVGYASHLTLSNTVPVSGGVTIGAPSGVDVTITETADVNLTDPWVDGTTVEIVSSAGTVTVSGPLHSEVTVDQINGTWTNTSALNVTNGKEIEVDPGDKPAFNVSGATDTVDVRESMAADDGTVDFVYSAGSGTTNLTLRGLAGSTQMGAVDLATNTLLDVDSTTAGGTLELEDMPSGTHTVHLVTSKGEPIIASTSPPDNKNVNQTDVTLEAEIKDPDFPTADNVTVEFYVDGVLNDTQHIQSNQTVTNTVSLTTGGDHTWRVETTDAYGQTNNSATFTITSPDQLVFREETNPDQLADSGTVRVTAYYGDEVQTRNVTGGTMDLTGFPIDQPIIVRAQLDNYTTRTAVIESIFEQNVVYLLNDSVPTYLVRFDLRDTSGTYTDEDTVLFVERDLNLSGSVEWRVIAGDNFGVQGIPTYLKQDERYRLRIKNLETGDSAVVGSFTAIQSETVIIEVDRGPITETGMGNQTYYWSFVENETAQQIVFTYNDSADQTETIKLTIHERFNESNVIVDNQTFTDTNRLYHQVPLTNAQVNKSWTALLYIDRGGGFEQYRIAISGGPTDILPGLLDSVWVTSIGVFLVLISGMAFSQLNQGVGAITTAFVGGLLWWVGILGGTAMGAAVVITIFVSVLWHVKNRGIA